MDKRVALRFQVVLPPEISREQLVMHVVGSCSGLGQWDISHSLSLNLVGDENQKQLWTGLVMVSPQTPSIQYRFILKRRTGTLDCWESFPKSRVIEIPSALEEMKDAEVDSGLAVFGVLDPSMQPHPMLDSILTFGSVAEMQIELKRSSVFGAHQHRSFRNCEIILGVTRGDPVRHWVVGDVLVFSFPVHTSAVTKSVAETPTMRTPSSAQYSTPNFPPLTPDFSVEDSEFSSFSSGFPDVRSARSDSASCGNEMLSIQLIDRESGEICARGHMHIDSLVCCEPVNSKDPTVGHFMVSLLGEYDVVGSIHGRFRLIKPFIHPANTLESLRVHREVKHRHHVGRNFIRRPMHNSMEMIERTLLSHSPLSFPAGLLSVDLNVCLTRDRVPVVYHSMQVGLSAQNRVGSGQTLIRVGLHTLTLAELKSVKVIHDGEAATETEPISSQKSRLRKSSFDTLHHSVLGLHQRRKRERAFKRIVADSLPAIADLSDKEKSFSPTLLSNFPTLKETLECLPAGLGAHIGVKFPEDPILPTSGRGTQELVEMNSYIDAILACVFENASSCHCNVVFSSHLPDACAHLKTKQARYPVFFRTSMDCRSTDPRRRSLEAACDFALATRLDGIFVLADPIFSSLETSKTQISLIKQRGLQCFVWGSDMSVDACVQLLELEIDGVFADGRIDEQDVFKRQVSNESGLTSSSKSGSHEEPLGSPAPFLLHPTRTSSVLCGVPADHIPLHYLTVDEVVVFMESLDLGRYCADFRRHCVDGVVLAECEDVDDIVSLRVQREDADRILDELSSRPSVRSMPQIPIDVLVPPSSSKSELVGQMGALFSQLNKEISMLSAAIMEGAEDAHAGIMLGLPRMPGLVTTGDESELVDLQLKQKRDLVTTLRGLAARPEL